MNDGGGRDGGGRDGGGRDGGGRDGGGRLLTSLTGMAAAATCGGLSRTGSASLSTRTRKSKSLAHASLISAREDCM